METNSKKPIIYLDMDGVLADFDAAYHKKFGKPPAPTSKEDPYISQLQGTDFFATLDKLPDADKVVALAKKYGEGKFSICSAPLRDDQKNTAHWKAVWLKKHYSGQPLENMVFTGKKDSYAVKGGQWNVLIDDKPKNINAWNARGGKGILYNGYTDSIEYLDQELSKIFSKENDITESSNMTEQQEQFVEMFSKFLPIAIKVLELKSLPKFHFESFLEHPQQPTFGMYVNGENKLFVGLSSRHPNDILRTIAHELTHYKQDTEHMLDDESGRTGSPIENEANAMAGIIMRLFNKKYPEYIRSKPVMEKWSMKYKKSINCSNPKGFSQRAHCQGRKKTEDVEQDPGQPIPFPAGTTSIDVSDPYDWYKLGMVISDLDDANPKAFGKGGPSTVIAFGSEDEEHRLLPHLKRLGLKLQDIDKPSDTEKIVPAKAVLDKFEENFADGRNPKTKTLIKNQSQNLKELFDPKLAVDLEWAEGSDYIAARGYVTVTNPDGFGGEYGNEEEVELEVEFLDYPHPQRKEYEVQFKVGGSHDITGGGNANVIFATVIQACKDFVEIYKPDRLFFTAKEQSRARMYDTITKRVAKQVGWHVIPFDEIQKDPLYRNSSDNGFVFVIDKGAAPKKWSSAQQPQHGSFMPIFYVYNVDKDTPTVAVKVRAPNRETAVQHAMKIEPSFKDLDLMQIHALNSLPKREVTAVKDGGTAEDPKKVGENFADGRNPQDKGDSGRHGIKKGITIAQLKKIRSSDSASPRKKQLAHWQINMRQGRSKKGK